jgi:hypothetical protein
MQQPPPKQKIRWVPAAVRRFFGRDQVGQVEQIGLQYSDYTTTAALTGGSGPNGARSRQLIYQKYQQMSADPLVSGAVRLHVTSALGGHETSGDLVFIEATAEAKKDDKLAAMVKELSDELAPIFNRMAFPAAYNAAIYGDAYARLYTKDRVGVTDMRIDELMMPALCIPFEQGNKTRVVRIATGSKLHATLTMDQVARVKMPRMLYTPQPLAIEKAWRDDIEQDDADKLQLMPSLVGGSFLADAETQYNNFAAALAGLVGQRILDSIDESIFSANVTGMTKEQRQVFLTSLERMLQRSKKIAEEALKSGQSVLQRIRHILPVWGEKQVVGVQGVNSGGATGTGRAGNLGVDDVMFHAKLLCGALGIDISMLGFADLMSGGLGDGGFFRTSAQAAERSRALRVSLAEFFYHVIDVHLIKKTGTSFAESERPFKVNFYGTISALEAERAKTLLDAVNSAMLMAQCFDLVKNIGMEEAAMANLFEKVMKLDAEDAKMYAKAIAKAKKEADAKEAAANAGGAFGGGGAPAFGDGDDDEPGGEPMPGGKAKAAPGAPKPVPVGA